MDRACVCMCVCVCVKHGCVCVCVCVRVCSFVYVLERTHTYAHVRVCVCSCTHVGCPRPHLERVCVGLPCLFAAKAGRLRAHAFGDGGVAVFRVMRGALLL